MVVTFFRCRRVESYLDGGFECPTEHVGMLEAFLKNHIIIKGQGNFYYIFFLDLQVQNFVFGCSVPSPCEENHFR